jgi:hypothetical protein
MQADGGKKSGIVEQHPFQETCMQTPDHRGFWEERWHPLREEWVIVAAHRQGRPWIG